MSCKKEPMVPTTEVVQPPIINASVPNRFGFNTIWMHGLVYNSPTSAISEVKNALKLLNHPIVRFPGGSIGNYYHYNGKDYGFWSQGNPAVTGENFIVKFADIVQSAGSPVAYVLNILEHFQNRYPEYINLNLQNNSAFYPQYDEDDDYLINENLQAIEYLLQKGIKIPIIEIGNELTLYPSYFGINLAKFSYKDDPVAVQNVVKPSIDRYLNVIVPLYKSKINQLMTQYGQSLPKYGVPIHTIRSGRKYYGDTRFFLSYWNERMKVANVDALIPHNYFDFGSNSSPSATLLRGRNEIQNAKVIFNEYKSMFGSKPLWLTEFNITAPEGTKNKNTGSVIHAQLLDEFIQAIVGEFNVEYYFLHQIFTDGEGYGTIHKKIINPGYAFPVNSLTSNGVTGLNPSYGKNLYYSYVFCWAAQKMGTSTANLDKLRNEYGCPF